VDRTRAPGRSRDGQGLVEYGLMTALTSVLTLLWLVVFGGTLSDALTAIGQAIDQAAGG
jgi:Flp pilus assembly pilin Flp